MHKEEKLEGIKVEEEKKIKKISTIIMRVIIVIGVLVTTDILLISKAHVGPFLAIKTKVYDDGGTKEYYGFGYKVIKYNQKVGRRDTVIGSWGIRYNTTPETYTIRELAYSIINDNNNHQGEFIRLTGTIEKKNGKAKTISIKFTDEEKGKYNLTVEAKILSKNIKDLNKNAPVSLIGTVTDYNNKTLTIENAFAE